MCADYTADKDKTTICVYCKHTLIDNSHGPDQNDFYINNDGYLSHSQRCTYCKFCNPRLNKDADRLPD